MKLVKLSGKKGYGLSFLVDNEDFNRVSQHTWWVDKLLRPQTDIKKKRVLIARFIMKPPKGLVIDHRNGNQLDNRKSNLRICSRKQNQRNRTRLNKNNSSGYRGISWDKFRSKWVAQLSLNYKHIFLGRFDNIKDARKIVKKTIISKHKDFANIKYV